MYACVVVTLLSQVIFVNKFIACFYIVLKSVQKKKFLQGFNSFTKRQKKPTCMTGICIGNSMICTDIWHKHHE